MRVNGNADSMKLKRFGKRCTVFCLAAALLTGFVLPSYADTTQDKLNKAASDIEALQQQKQEQEDALSGLTDYKNNLSGDLKELDGQLNEISVALEDTTAKIAAKNSEIEKKEAAIGELTVKSQEQYEAMKLRIKYIYEQGQSAMLGLLFESKSLSDFLNRTEYAAAIQTYDRNMLTQYEQTLASIKVEKQELSAAKEEYVALEAELETKQDEVNTLIAQKQEKIREADAQIADTKERIESAKQELERQRAYEDELEKQKAAEDAARIEELKRQEEEAKKQQKKENGKGGTVVPAAGDEALLAAIIECEAGSEGMDGKLAVGSVVLNRVASSLFPNTVVGVIYQSGQFSPVASGRFAAVLAKGAGSSSVQAAQAVLAGKRTIDALYFRRNNGTIEGTVIGNHVFF